MRLSIPMPPSVNNLFINAGKKRIRSPRYKAWAIEAGLQLNAQRPLKLVGPVALIYEFQEGQDNRKRDIGNLEKATTDLLVEHQIIEADDSTIVREITLRWSKEIIGARVTVLHAEGRQQDREA